MFEIVCGICIALGLLTRLAVLPTIAIMLVAIAATKLPILASADESEAGLGRREEA